MTNFKLINLSEKKRWNNILENSYHFAGNTWEYSKLQSIITGNKTFLLTFDHKDKKFFCPFNIKKKNKVEYIFTPQGYTGFNLAIDLNIFNKLIKFFKYKNYLTAYITLNPLIDSLDQEKQLNLKKKNISYVIDLNLTDKNIQSNYKNNIKKNINISVEKNFIIKEYSDLCFLELKEIYLDSLKRFGMSKGFECDKKFISFLFKNYESKICLLALKDDVIYSSSIFILGTDTAEYFINISLPGYNYLSSYLIDKSYKFLRKKGIKKLNLGGSVKKKPGIEQFKKSFRSDEHNFYYLKKVIDKIKYHKLCVEGDIFPTFKMK